MTIDPSLVSRRNDRLDPSTTRVIPRNEFQERIGVGSTNYGLARTGPTRERKVIAEEGPRKGRTAAIQTDHASGRVDARVIVDTVSRKLSLKEN